MAQKSCEDYHNQCRGAGSARIRIMLGTWILIRMNVEG
jgi:hypothetical protein